MTNYEQIILNFKNEINKFSGYQKELLINYLNASLEFLEDNKTDPELIKQIFDIKNLYFLDKSCRNNDYKYTLSEFKKKHGDVQYLEQYYIDNNGDYIFLMRY